MRCHDRDDLTDTVAGGVDCDGLIDARYSAQGVFYLSKFNSISLMLDLAVLASDEVDLAVVF